MKKLFVLFLLVALVPFSVGCWNDSDDDPVATSNVLLNQALPAGSFAANAIADFSKLTYEVVIGGTTHTFYYKSHKAEGTNIIFTFYKPVVSSSYASYVGQISGQPATSAAVKFDGNEIASVTTGFTMPTISTTPSTTGEGETVILTITNIDLSKIPAANLVATYSVDTVIYVPTTGTEVTIGQDPQATYNVNSTTPTFKINFKLDATDTLPESLTGVTFTVLVRNEATKAEFTLTSTDGLTVTRGTDGKSVSIAINASNSLGKTLQVGSKYSVAITKTSMIINSKYLALPGAYYFTVTQ